MRNKEYCFCIEDDELESFLSFCEVNNITFSNGNRFPLGETTFLLRGNEIKAVELSDDDYCFDWDDFIEDYYSDLSGGLSTKDILDKLKSDGYSFNGSFFTYGEFCLDPEHVLGCLDSIHCDLLEIIFESNRIIDRPEKSVTKSKSYLDFNPFK